MRPPPPPYPQGKVTIVMILVLVLVSLMVPRILGSKLYVRIGGFVCQNPPGTLPLLYVPVR